MNVQIKQLTVEHFKPYGQVIEVPASLESTISNEQITYWKQQAILNIDGPIEIGVLKVKQHDMVFNQMEKHEETPEMLIGLDGAFIVPVAPSTLETPEADKVEAFEVGVGQAVVMSTNCWHWTPCPVGKSEITILVLFKDNTSQNDLVIKDLEQECKIVK
jgi:ureidoglycolate hydrolase